MSDHVKKESSARVANNEKFNKDLNRLKHDLELWREVLLGLHSVLTWEKPIYAGCVSFAVTAVFVFIYMLNASVLTLMSLFGMLLLIVDYAGPLLVRFLFQPKDWTGEHEKRFEHLCGVLCEWRVTISEWLQAFMLAKEQKSVKFYVGSFLTLVACLYLSESIDNLLLCYTLCMMLVLSPGLQKPYTLPDIYHKVKRILGLDSPAGSGKNTTKSD